MDESEQESTKSELSDSWMVINETPADQTKENGTSSDGSDGESVEVIDQEEYDEVLTGEADCDAARVDEEVNGPKNKKYVHHPNKDVNAALNRLMVIAASVVVGLAVGHYLGYSEEVNDMATTVKKLQAENFRLKNHICKTLENYDNHITGSGHPEMKHFNENYAIFLTVLLNLTCQHTEAKVLGLQTSLDNLRQAFRNGHMSDDELQDRIDKILKNQSSGHEVTDYTNFPDERRLDERKIVTTQDEGLSATFTQTTETSTYKERSSEILTHPESPTEKVQDKSTSKKEIPEDTTGISILESAPLRVGFQAEATKMALSEGRINSLAKSLSKSSEGCQVATDSKDSPVSTEVPDKNLLKRIVKDVAQEITDSLLALHHDDIKGIRNEAQKLMRGFPIFKSVLLLNMEVAAKIKSYLHIIEGLLHSVLQDTTLMTDREKIVEVFSIVKDHAFHLEKAMDYFQLIEVTLNKKRTGMSNVERSDVCTISDFVKEIFINNHHNTHTVERNRKHSNDPHEQNNMYAVNRSPSGKNVIDGATVENLSQKSTVENVENISDLENLHKTKDNKFVTQQPPHGRHTKYDKRQRHEVKEKKKIKKDNDNKKYKKSKQHSAETERHNEKDEGKYKDYKREKENRHDRVKNLRKQYHYKEEKYFKRELSDMRKKNSPNMYKWDTDGDYRHSNMSGDWVIDMNRARAESRDNEHKSDWLFERAYARKAKRNGKWDMNNWYFQRAEGRKSCRQKSGVEKSKIPYPLPNESEKEYRDNNNKQHQKQRKYFKPKRWVSKAYMTVSKF